jgi:HlyD family secretion protein
LPTGSVLEASGFVIAGRQATVSASITGRIARLQVTEGSFVRRGQPIAELDAGISDAQVAYAEAGVRAADKAAGVTRARMQAANRDKRRSEDLAAQGFVSQASLEQTTAALESLQAQLTSDLSQVEVARKQLALQREQLRSVKVVAPFDGVVTSVSAHVGEIVSPISGSGGFTRTGICTIVDPESVEGEVDVSEQYLGRLRKDLPVSVRFPAYPDITVSGRIAVLPAAVDRNTAAIKVKITFDDLVQQLTPGMRADFTFMAPGVSGSAASSPARNARPAPALPAKGRGKRT